jgi:hypothetical protein
VQKLHLVAVLLLSPASLFCSSSQVCTPPVTEFAFETEFTEHVLAEYLAADDSSRDAIDCESMCAYMYAEYGDERYVDSVDTCEQSIEPEGGASPEEIAGSIACTGDAVEYVCG